MKQLYKDILALTKKPPLWYDEHGVPRYTPFHPDDVADIYARLVVFLEIKCQECGCPFKVAISSSGHGDIFAPAEYRKRAEDAMKAWRKRPSRKNCPFFYGDPPRHGNTQDGKPKCYAGDTMNSEPVRILEYWEKGNGVVRWKRLKRCEIEVAGL